MIASSEFWEKEKEAPLLNRNANFFRPESADELLQRAQRLLQLLDKKHGKDTIEQISLKPNCDDEAAKRIFKLDAERTFKSEECRQQLVEVLSSLWPELLDYHQGLGFVVSFLLLVLPASDVLRLCVGLHRLYLQGYFKAAPVAYVRDARVMQKLLDQRQPELGSHLKELACAEAYASKWFVGLNVHVLTFEALFDFMEALIETGDVFLFQFALSLVDNCKDELLKAANAAEVLEILRLDAVRYTNKHKAHNHEKEGSFFVKIVKDAREVQIDEEHIKKLREEALEDLRLEEERRKQRDKEVRYTPNIFN
ncbi:uncharacterized protein EMH_0021460 [Eimeria mitis]|uniref:Rab-GAP TBC domain-containing protein n=1 Tax=Eimeria mitis TaxID=44415 RepID=U6JV60_9EIME|nr:uncharacterized protein EMH_0021460 [Eimeria mitis]CDJ29319.1 hypothetical protein, conserved [Eimeria mitis]